MTTCNGQGASSELNLTLDLEDSVAVLEALDLRARQTDIDVGPLSSPEGAVIADICRSWVWSQTGSNDTAPRVPTDEQRAAGDIKMDWEAIESSIKEIGHLKNDPSPLICLGTNYRCKGTDYVVQPEGYETAYDGTIVVWAFLLPRYVRLK